eukprot:UN25693
MLQSEAVNNKENTTLQDKTKTLNNTQKSEKTVVDLTNENNDANPLYVRIRYKGKQKLRELPASRAELILLVKELHEQLKMHLEKDGQEKDIYVATSEGDWIESEDDYKLQVKAFKQQRKKNQKFQVEIFLDEEEISNLQERWLIPRTNVITGTNFSQSSGSGSGWTPPGEYMNPFPPGFPPMMNGPPQMGFWPPPPEDEEGIFPPMNGKRNADVMGGSMPPNKRRKYEIEKAQMKDEKRKLWTAIRDEKCTLIEGEYPKNAAMAGGLWYCGLCLVCLTPVQYCNLHGHLQGGKHQNAYGKRPLKASFRRIPPILITEEQAMQCQPWIREKQTQGYPLVYLCDKKRFKDLCCYKPGYRVLTLGEQDFSFTLSVAKYGCETVGTSYLGAYDKNVADPNPSKLDDADRETYKQLTLSSMNGDLEKNIKHCGEKGITIRYDVDATKLKETLIDKGVEGEFDIIAFPFPRASLFRGCDPGNSFLLRDFFNNVIKNNVLRPGGIVQLVMLESQFNEWDVHQLSLEANFSLKYMVAMNFEEFKPY